VNGIHERKVFPQLQLLELRGRGSWLLILFRAFDFGDGATQGAWVFAIKRLFQAFNDAVLRRI
jgi:hypothetical protein